jgi:hypothetical protein
MRSRVQLGPSPREVWIVSRNQCKYAGLSVENSCRADWLRVPECSVAD